MTSVREQWEDRARDMGASHRSVLFKGFSDGANGTLDAWHKRLLRELLEREMSAGAPVLDLGCGYGRLALAVATDRPDILLIGQDISRHYCALLAAAGGIAVQGDQMALPFKPGCFAGAYAVTTLMYANREAVAEILRCIRGVLRPGAPLLVVDPGEEMRSLIERIARRRTASRTGGRGFRRDEYQRLAQDAGFDIVRQGGNPRDSLLLLLTLGGKLGWRWIGRLLPRDGVRGGYSRIALHRWLLLRTPGANTQPGTRA